MMEEGKSATVKGAVVIGQIADKNERPTMKDLNRYVTKKYASDWEDIGVELGLELDVLKITGRDNPLQSIACLRETLDNWLKLNTDDATWKTLEVALTNVNRAKLGLDPVDDVYVTVMDTSECAANGNQSSVQAVISTDTPPACEKLMTSMSSIEIQFAKMTSRIKQALINNNVDVVSLIEQLCTISAVKSKKVPLFDEDLFEKIQSINEFWRKLRIFWNIFDYDLLQYVVEISDCREAQDIFEKFLSGINPSVIEDVNLVLHCSEEHPEGSLKPVLRIKVNTDKCTLNIKKMVEEVVSKKYDLHAYTLRFQGIREGCIELSYYISKSLKLYLLQFKISDSIQTDFLAHKIISLQIDESKLDITNEKLTWHPQKEDTAVPAWSNHQLQDQLPVPDEFEERTNPSAPIYSGEASVSEKAEEIMNKFENFRMDSTKTVHTQSSSPVEQHEEEDNTIQYPVPAVSQPTPPAMKLQHQFSEFPLDETVLTLGQDGYYLEYRDYDVIREAGARASACCNLGKDRMKKNQFIVKKPKKSFSDEEKQDMMRELRILKELNHDNVIRFYGAVEDLQEYCFKIFLEYADETCGDIHYLFCESEDKESFSGNIALIMLYIQQMLFAVDYLHWTRGILHLDIKGKNIVVCNGGYRVKLIDFGTACKANDALPQKIGWTPVFAAPEVNNQSQPPKFSADIWSVMCVAVEMVTEDLPWPKETNHQTAVYKIGCYEDDQITELVQYDEYWDKYSYYQEHQEMYEELVHMWKIVFRKDSSSRPSANELLHHKWMKEMEIDGESILRNLINGEEEQLTEQSQSVENDPAQSNHGESVHHDLMSGGEDQPIKPKEGRSNISTQKSNTKKKTIIKMLAPHLKRMQRYVQMHITNMARKLQK